MADSILLLQELNELPLLDESGNHLTAIATAEPAASDDGENNKCRVVLILQWLRQFVRPAVMSAIVAFHFALSAYCARWDWEPWRRQLLLAVAGGYASVAALMWFDWRIEAVQELRPLDATEQRIKLAARILASVVVGVLAYFTASPVPCPLLLFIWYFGGDW